jgi:PAS domain S-box-containing protein
MRMNPADRHIEISRSLFREANDAIFLFDPQTQIIIDLNPVALRLTGLEKDAACKMRLDEIFSGSTPGGMEGLSQAMARTGFFHSREGYSLKRCARADLPVNISVSRIHIEPEPVGLVVARDISDRKQAEEALKQVETRYNSLVASTGVIVWELDAGGIMVSLSPAFGAITGWPRGEWIGRRLNELVHPDDRQTAQVMHERAWKGETLPRYELRIRTRSGEYLDCEFLLETKIRDGSTDRVVAIVRNITERKRNEMALEQADALRRAKEEAERANRAKSEFLSSVSHEIRTPLTAILGFVDLLGEHPSLRGGDAEIEEHFATIRQNGQFLLALIDDLLDISRIEAGQLRIEREACSPRAIVADVVESLRAKAEAKNLRIDVEFPGEIPHAIATDRLRLQQILVNLLDNALKFTARGTVRITTTTAGEPGSEPVLQFAVSDMGVGMTEAEMAGLFQPFYRARSMGTEGPGGTGLGLAICERIAKRLGGDITVCSAAGSGSTFTLKVPVGKLAEIRDSEPAEHAKAPRSADLAASPPPRLQARILLADDNPANQKLISIRLARAGAEVVTANDGKEALDRTRDAVREGRPFDAVIMDMQMPVLDGYEAVRQLRASGFTDPILAVTAYAMSDDREECLRLGCDDFISKPIEWDRFLGKLTRLLAAKNGPSGERDVHARRA